MDLPYTNIITRQELCAHIEVDDFFISNYANLSETNVIYFCALRKWTDKFHVVGRLNDIYNYNNSNQLSVICFVNFYKNSHFIYILLDNVGQYLILIRKVSPLYYSFSSVILVIHYNRNSFNFKKSDMHPESSTYPIFFFSEYISNLIEYSYSVSTVLYV